jgi:2-polyprenyl-6-methoxyphenol hydroxylase-like FAD-dependent oxidoreductase
MLIFIVLPHQAGGAMSAIEDAEALGVFLRDTSPKPESESITVTEALQRVFRVRFRRASQVQHDSHVEGIQAAAPPTPDKLLQIWNYKGAVKWAEEHPELVLKEGEEATFVPET